MVALHAALQGTGLLQTTASFIARQDGRCANRHCKPCVDRCVWPERRPQVGTFYLTQAPPELAARLLNYLLITQTEHVQIDFRDISRVLSPTPFPVSYIYTPAQARDAPSGPPPKWDSLEATHPKHTALQPLTVACSQAHGEPSRPTLKRDSSEARVHKPTPLKPFTVACNTRLVHQKVLLPFLHALCRQQRRRPPRGRNRACAMRSPGFFKFSQSNLCSID